MICTSPGHHPAVPQQGTRGTGWQVKGKIDTTGIQCIKAVLCNFHRQKLDPFEIPAAHAADMLFNPGQLQSDPARHP